MKNINLVNRVMILLGLALISTSTAFAFDYATKYSQCMNRFNGAECRAIGLYTIKERAEIINGLRLIQRACKLDDAQSCNILGDIFNEGKKACEDPFLAKQYYDKACRLGLNKACESYNQYVIKGTYEFMDVGEVVARYFNIYQPSTANRGYDINGGYCHPLSPQPKKYVDHTPPRG